MDSLVKNPSLGNKARFEPGTFEIQGASESAMSFRPVQTFVSVSTRAFELLKV